MKCAICRKEAVKKGYCGHHIKAYESIVETYNGWERALELSWKQYLKEIAKNSVTGEWAKEVAKHLIKNGEKENVSEK